MNNSYLSLSAKVTLAFMGLGIVLMLGTSLIQRFAQPSLIVPGRPTISAEEAEKNRISAEVGRHMEELKENPNDIPNILHVVDLLIQTEQWDSAEVFLRRALALDAKLAKAHYLLGMVLFNQEKYVEAATELEKVFLIEEDPSARYSLGVLHIYYLNDMSTGRLHLQKALENPAIPEELAKAIQMELQKEDTPVKDATQAVE